MSNNIWDNIYSIASRSRKRGVTADEIVQSTGYNRSTVSSYLTLLTQSGYLKKSGKTRPNTSGRHVLVYTKLNAA